MKTGLVLSGGGARGIAHLGVLKALEELNIKIDEISGVSAGAIFGAFYAAGQSVSEIDKMISAAKFFDLMNFRIGKPGFFNSKSFRTVLEKNLHIQEFEALKIPLTIAATDYKNAEIVYFKTGNLIDAVVASSSIPIIFEPCLIDETYYVDGGLLNNFPVEPLVGNCDVIIGIHVNPINTAIVDFSLRSMMERVFLMAIRNAVKEKIKFCSLFIEPEELSRFHVFDTSNAAAISEIGYTATMKQKDKLLSFYE
jgi:NTE family protein